MAVESAAGASAHRSGDRRITPSPAALIALTAVAGLFADGLRRCLARTARLAGETHHLIALSRTDPLTGLPNRRHVEEHLTGAVSAARRHRHGVSVLFIDIDSFKRVNDESGYEVGDEVLREVGRRVRLAVRAEDLVGRWGGEEFVAVLPTTDRCGALAVAERVRTAVAARAVTTGAGETEVTVSVGCASAVDEPGELIRQASQALREAKRAGKNRVVAAADGGD